MKDAITVAKGRWPEATHLRVAENVTLCMRGGDRSFVSVWGQYLTDASSEVGCPDCMTWMHA